MKFRGRPWQDLPAKWCGQEEQNEGWHSLAVVQALARDKFSMCEVLRVHIGVSNVYLFIWCDLTNTWSGRVCGRGEGEWRRRRWVNLVDELIYTYICTYYIYVYMCIYVCVYIYMYVCMYVHTHEISCNCFKWGGEGFVWWVVVRGWPNQCAV
jgi:hypothetical protein